MMPAMKQWLEEFLKPEMGPFGAIGIVIAIVLFVIGMGLISYFYPFG